MLKIHGILGTVIGALAVVAQHAVPWAHHRTRTDQPVIAPYLLPANSPETDMLRQLRATSYRLMPQTIGSNPILRTTSESVTSRDEASAVVTRARWE